jgi:hypothetical protein
MRPTPDPIECLDDVDEVTILVMPRIAEGYFVAWKNDKLMCWGQLGAEGYPVGADTVALSPVDYVRLKQLEALHDAKESCHGHA